MVICPSQFARLCSTLTVAASSSSASCALGLIWLVASAPATLSSADVEWVIDSALEDASCDHVCGTFGMLCTELCWPSGRDGLEAIQRAPGVLGTCVNRAAESQGSPAAWHPSKDPETHLCYWDVGTFQGLRCPVTPVTPASQVAADMRVRRLCPCTRGNVVGDCGLDAAAVDSWNFTDASFSTVAASSTQMSFVPMSSSSFSSQPVAGDYDDIAARNQSSSGLVSSANEISSAHRPSDELYSGDCLELCVGGFSDEESDLNGRYSRSRHDERLHWTKQQDPSHASVRLLTLSKDVGSGWSFFNAGSTVLAASSQTSSATAQVPQEGVFSTPAGQHHLATFTCCAQLDAFLATRMHGNADSGGLSAVVIAIILVGFALVGMFSTLAWARLGPKIRISPGQQACVKTMPHPNQMMNPKKKEDPCGGPITVPDIPGTKHVGFALPSPIVLRNSTLQPIDDPRQLLRNELRDVQPRTSGLYERPVTKQRETTDEQGLWQNNSMPEVAWEEGAEVRLHSLDATMATWNGAEGVINGFIASSGQYQVRLVDGRVKAVRPENLDLCSSPMRRSPRRAQSAGDADGTTDSVKSASFDAIHGTATVAWAAPAFSGSGPRPNSRGSSSAPAPSPTKPMRDSLGLPPPVPPPPLRLDMPCPPDAGISAAARPESQRSNPSCNTAAASLPGRGRWGSVGHSGGRVQRAACRGQDSNAASHGQGDEIRRTLASVKRLLAKPQAVC